MKNLVVACQTLKYETHDSLSLLEIEENSVIHSQKICQRLFLVVVVFLMDHIY